MAEEFIRTPTRASGALTKEEEAAMAVITQEWIDVAYRTGRCNKQELIEAIKSLYAIVDHPIVPIVVVASSPHVMTVAATICTRYYKHKDVGNEREGYDDVQKVYKYLENDEFLPNIKEVVQAVINLPETPKGLKTGGKAVDTSNISLSDFLQGGNFWPALPAFYAACRDVLNLKLPCFDKYGPWEACAKLGGYRWMHENFCIVCDYPDLLKVDDQFRPHNTEGPSHSWADGWKLWHIDGRAVTEQIVMDPKSLTVEQINREEDNDVRAIMLERKGWADYIREARLEPVGDVYENAVENTLEVLYATPFNHKVLVATCTTGRLFALPVVDSCSNVHEARDWIHGGKKRNIIGRT